MPAFSRVVVEGFWFIVTIARVGARGWWGAGVGLVKDWFEDD
jgi:hypothetical protein